MATGDHPVNCPCYYCNPRPSMAIVMYGASMPGDPFVPYVPVAPPQVPSVDTRRIEDKLEEIRKELAKTRLGMQEMVEALLQRGRRK